MSKYTTQLRFICETMCDLKESVGYSDIDEVIKKSYKKIFNFNFPIFDENYREHLCVAILKHYYTREICEETVGLWKLRLNAKMNEIMPYYNKLYIAWTHEFNPLYDTDLTRENELKKKETGEGVQKSHSVDNTTNRNLYADTPQGSIQDLESERYLTNARKIIDSGDNKTDNNYNQTSTGLDEFIEKIKGKSSGVSYSKMLEEYKQSLINIDLMIINELNGLFMLIW